MAQRIVDLIAKKNKLNGGENIPNCTTENIELSGGKVGGAVKFADFVKNKLTHSKELGLTATEAEMLLNRYGSNIDTLFNIIEKLKKEPTPTLPKGGRANTQEKQTGFAVSNPSPEFITIQEGGSSAWASTPPLRGGREGLPLPLLLRAQLHYCIEHEMCTTPSDFFIRRTGALYFDIETVKMWETPLLLYMRKLMDWDDNLTAKFDAELQKAGQQISISV